MNKRKTLTYLTIASILLKVVDVVTTYLTVTMSNVNVELNPVMRYGIKHFGLVETMVLALVIHSLCTLSLMRRGNSERKNDAVSVLVVVVVLLTVLAISNTVHMLRVLWTLS